MSNVYPHSTPCIIYIQFSFFPVCWWWMNELAPTAFMSTLDTSGVIHLVKYKIHLNKLHLIWATFVDRANFLSYYVEPSQWHPCQFIQHVLIWFHQQWMSISLSIFICIWAFSVRVFEIHWWTKAESLNRCNNVAFHWIAMLILFRMHPILPHLCIEHCFLDAIH